MSEDNGFMGQTPRATQPSMYDLSREKMEQAWTPQNVGASIPSAPPVVPVHWSSGGVGGAPGAQWLSLSTGGLLLFLALGVVLWMNTSFLLAGGLIIGALVGAVVGTVLLWPAVRIWSSGARLGRIFEASLLSMCAYGAAMYVLTNHGGRTLSLLDQHLQLWLSASPLFAKLHAPAPIVSFLVVTQVPCVLLCGATIRWRLKGAFAGVTGYLRACAVSLAILIILAGGATVLVRQVLQNFDANLQHVADR